MSNFDTLRQGLQQARAERDAAAARLAAARQAIKRASAAQSQAQRAQNARDPAAAKRLDALQAQTAHAEAELKAQRAAYAQARERADAALVAFADYTDPRTQVRAHDDAYPALLLPVRMETRFKTINDAQGARHELWVRVYPDDCAVDSFEPVLSDSEIATAQTYWAGIWAAGGIEAQERTAWKALVASHGSGRAAWIVQQYQPTNLAAKPTKADAADVILVIATDAPPAAAAQTALANYWNAVWRADGDATQIAAAKATLDTAVGGTTADALIASYTPTNLSAAPADGVARADVALQTSFILLPQNVATQTTSWTQPAKTTVLPERFVLIGYQGTTIAFEQLGALIPSPLIVGPDPSAPAGAGLRQEGDEIVVDDDLRWMIDFDRAIAQGMGFKVALTPAQARSGFDRLIVLGIRLAGDAADGQQQLQTLLQHQRYSRSGLAIIAQGTPTNNTDGEASGYSRNDDADASYDDLKQALFTPTSDVLARRDGQWLAEYLSVDPSLFAHVHGADGSDQAEARAMNTALWPATLGYMMETMLHPLFDPTQVEQVYAFFTQYVSGRGAVPAIRIGRQPYGILPATAFSRMAWMTPSRTTAAAGAGNAFLQRLYGVLRTIDADWATLARSAKHIGQAGDPQQTLLDVVGLHASSVEYYQRYAESLEQLFNRLNLEGLGGELMDAIIAGGYVQSGMQLLQRLGYSGAQPDVLSKFFLSGQQFLQGAVIDDRPLSERDAIRSYTVDGKNYLTWMRDAARSDPDRLRLQTGFLNDAAPSALLYLFMRHALLLGYYDAGLRAHSDAGIFDAATIQARKHEAPFVHVQAASGSESRWQPLYTKDARITADPNLRVIDYLARNPAIGATRYLNDQLRALDVLCDVPTARLERAFAEHIDCCSYRFDAWWLGLVHAQLAFMRSQKTERGQVRTGVYLGAYGWLEDVRPRAGSLSEVRLAPDLDAVFNKPGESRLMQDSSNGGYIQAPSLNHAATAAVLRAGYMANAGSANARTLAVNLSSERVRRALLLLEGIRNGQTLGALLGYQLERGLHDRHAVAEVDAFIYALRKAFPLVADHIGDTQTASAVPIEAIEARNVVDGLALVNWITSSGNANYPFGKSLPTASAAQASAIDSEVTRLLDTHDALADLMVAEGVHQSVQGNFDRAAAAMDDLSKGHFPPEPDVVRTPRSGITLTHRVGLQLQPGLDPTVSPWAGIAMTARAAGEPALNQWLAGRLPAPETIACRVTYFDMTTAAAVERLVTVHDLALQPIDLLYLVPTQGGQAMTELDDRIARQVIESATPRPDAELTIHYTDRVGDNVSLFELAALLQHLRTLALHSRPLRATDVALHNEARPEQDEAVFVDAARIDAARTKLADVRATLASFIAPLQTALADTVANRTTLIDDIDTNLDAFIDAVAGAAAFGVPHSGFGFAYGRKRELYTQVLASVQALVVRWHDRLGRYDGLIADYDSLPASTPDDVLFGLLRKAEGLITTLLANPLPSTPAAFRTALDAKRAAFAGRLAQFEALLATNETALAALLADVTALLPVSDFDRDGIDLVPIGDEVIALETDLLTVAQGVTTAIDDRISRADAQIALAASATSNRDRADTLTAAAKAMFGDDYVLIPEFLPSDTQATEWMQSIAASSSGDLLRYQQAHLQNDFPVDEWMYGVARVRDKLRAWEQATVLTEGVGATPAALTPIQLPYRVDDHWLGLSFPPDYVIDSDRLLYTAHYSVPVAHGARQCGLLIDEWTEVIPARNETAGVAFHYDRPNAEPPQAMLLATPAAFTGAWQWQDLLDAVNETLDLAKKRAVEPVQVDATAYARFLPATLMATTLYQISISANLAENNRVYTQLAQEIHE